MTLYIKIKVFDFGYDFLFNSNGFTENLKFFGYFLVSLEKFQTILMFIAL